MQLGISDIVASIRFSLNFYAIYFYTLVTVVLSDRPWIA